VAVEGDQQAGYEQLIRALTRGWVRLVALARPDELDIVPTLAQSLDHEAHRAGDAVDLRRIGFGDHCDAKRVPGTGIADRCIHVRAQCAPGMNTR
jgi:hypothetical protein